MGGALTILIIASAISAVCPQQCDIQGECIGDIVGVTSENSVIDCLNVCSEDVQDCAWFTFNLESGYCGLQITCGFIDAESCPTCISGESTCSPNDFLSCELPGMCLGTILHQDVADDQQDCQDLCAAYDGCNFYTYDGADSFCQLFATCPDQSEDFCEGCISGQPGCEIGNGAEEGDGESYMMVIGGRGSSDRAMEVVSLDPESQLPECLTNLKDLPFPLDGGAGAALSDGTPVACSSHNSTCFKYKAEDDSWFASGDMIDERENSGFAYNNVMGLVMAGGQGPGDAGESVESTVDGSTFQPLTQMPVTNYYHCLVSVDDDTLLSIGGEIAADKAYIYRTSSNSWTEVASMSLSRRGHSCGVVDGSDGKKEVIVVGGAIGGDEFNRTDSVEIYSISDNTWREGTPFPHTIDDAASVQFNGTFLVVGGYVAEESDTDDRIYEYATSTETWRLLPVTLNRTYQYHTAFMVPKSIFPVCDP